MSISWADWGEAARARARAEGKPILLSLTATWCHACHRMDDDTWADPGVAAVVERSTVPVRVDADERPDVYAHYHLGGLPTTAILDADGQFIRGGTFLAPAQCLGLLDSALADLASGRRPQARSSAAPPPPTSLVDALVDRLRRRADPEHGGFGMAPKLPEPDAITLLLRHGRGTGDPVIERIARAALDAIATHLADPVDGGFYRYAAGHDWSGPHTEKLALDQAMLIRLFLEAFQTLGDRDYLDVALGALVHARHRLVDEEGRVLASVAADPGYYARRDGGSDETDDLPPVDPRRFADAAAAMTSATLHAHALTGDDATVGDEIFARAASGAVPHRLDAPGPLAGLLRDQALTIRAAVDRHRLTGDPQSLDLAHRLARWTIDTLWDESAPAFRASPAGDSLTPMTSLVGNGEMAQALADLADHSTGDARADLRDRAQRLVDALTARAATSPAGPTLGLAALRLREEPPVADLTGDPADPGARALARAAVAALGPSTAVRWTPGAPASLTLCVRDVRLPPIADAAEVAPALVRGGLAPERILGAT